MTNTIFNSDYYKKVITEFGYDQSLFEGFTDNFSDLPKADLEKTFLCHHGLYDFEKSPQKKIITSGFGLSGVPHIGTLSQLYRLGLLNKAGYDVQIVLGDLDAYNGKNIPLAQTRDLAAIYTKFIHATQLLDPTRSIIRDQFESPATLRMSYLIGRFIDDSDFQSAEEDLHTFYAAKGKVDSTMSYRRKLSLNLMLADFFDVGQRYPQVLVLLGIDEHQYVRMGQMLAQKINYHEALLSPVTIHSLYTPIIKGLSGYPKMSKSFPDSGITLDMTAEKITTLVMAQKRDEQTAMHDDVIFQIICSIGLESTMSIAAIEAAYTDPTTWEEVKVALVARICYFAKLWQEASA